MRSNLNHVVLPYELLMYCRGVPSAQSLRFFKKAYFSTGAYPIPTFLDKKIENRINFWRARPDFLVPGGLGHPQVPGESLFGQKLKIYVETLYWEHF